MARKTEWWKNPEIMGTALAPKLANIQTTFDMKNQRGIAPAGVVEAGEYVFDKNAVKGIGTANLDKIRAEGQKKAGLPSYCSGGKVKGLPSYAVGGLVSNPWEKAKSAAKDNEVPVNSPFADVKKSNALSTYRAGLGTPVMGAGVPTYSAPKTALGGISFNTAAPTAYTPKSTPIPNVGVAPKVAAPEWTPPPPATVVNKIPTQPPKSTEELARLRGLQGIGQIASGQHPLFRTLANQAQQQIATQGAMDEASLRQQMAQMGVTGGAANAMMADLNRDIGSNLAGAAATTAVNAQKMSAETIGQLATEGLAGMRFDYGKQVDAMNQALATRNYDAYSKIAESLYGVTLNTDALKTADSGAAFADAMQGLSTAMARPNAKRGDPDVEQYLQAAWEANSPGQPMDETWANNLFEGQHDGASSIAAIRDAIEKDDLLGAGYTETDIASLSFGGVTGMTAVNRALLALGQPGGGLVFDANGNWSFGTTDAANFIAGLYNPKTENGITTPSTPVTTTTGFTKGTDGFWTYDGEKMTDTAGNYINNFDTATRIGWTTNGAPVKVSDSGVAVPYTFADYQNDKDRLTDPATKTKILSNVVISEPGNSNATREIMTLIGAPTTITNGLGSWTDATLWEQITAIHESRDYVTPNGTKHPYSTSNTATKYAELNQSYNALATLYNDKINAIKNSGLSQAAKDLLVNPLNTSMVAVQALARQYS